MDKYIKREYAIDTVLDVYCDTPDIDLSCEKFEAAIRKIQSADVAPVRHGRWLCVDTDTEQFFLCNRCKKKEYWESDYCPNCGARMDEEVLNEYDAICGATNLPCIKCNPGGCNNRKEGAD